MIDISISEQALLSRSSAMIYFGAQLLKILFNRAIGLLRSTTQ